MESETIVAGAVGGDLSPLFGKIALIDADILCYRSAAAAEHKFYLVRGVEVLCEFDNAKDAKVFMKEIKDAVLWNRVEDSGEEFAIAILEASLKNLLELTKCSGYELWLSGKHNFRDDIAVTKPYKGNREHLSKPKHLKACKELLKEKYGAKETFIGEADDALGIRSRFLGEQSFIASIDKDMDQLCGWHYDWIDNKAYSVSKREGDFNLYSQILTGDSTDNVPGLPGVGPKIAAQILDGARSSRDLFERCWNEYRIRSESPAAAWKYFMEQAALVYILREQATPYQPPYPYKPLYIPAEVAGAIGIGS